MSMRWMNAALVLCAALMLVWVDPAHAAEQGREAMVLTQGPMLQVVVVLGLLAAASLLSYLSPGVMGRRFGVVAGAHYVLLGALVAATGAGFSAKSLSVF